MGPFGFNILGIFLLITASTMYITEGLDCVYRSNSMGCTRIKGDKIKIVAIINMYDMYNH